ncbi:putative NADPH dehydrogenase [Penicillium chrysogenum]|jgi:2,4-dienoyl-CoA reductase-like NADH-dependent reductase (Old Yellow Enzyme family)|uniref:Pc21g14230 protein n=2 Tax=Penicillium chrysogenum species complex TaxID=254878 RepID=B6HHP5_PENRW|nr:putative NADPH dehydrogenase [Penicillium chrysogenum]CAP96320.1 Pc21g14230 [Penicillium rubens Wisconsin 54-1255]
MGSTSFRSPPNHQAEGVPYFTPANNAGAAVNPQDPSTPTLFRPLQIRDVTLKNRVIVAPMCMYSTESDPTSPAVGALTDFHIAHLGHFATKGAGLVFIEATSVQPNGRISPNDSGLWQDGTDSEQFKGLRRVVNFAHSQGAKIGIQLAHAGRKASTVAPWLASQAKQRGIKADESVGGWPSDVVGPSGGEEQIWAPGDQFWPPRELETAEVEEIVRAFARSAALAAQAGVDVIEIHGAHGYLLHQFLSPVTNRRIDKYGGSFENRTRLLCEVAAAIRAVVPSGMPLFLRISATDWLDNQTVAAETGSWDVSSSIQLAKLLPDLGIDFLDVSSGGNHKSQRIEPHTNYQIDLAGQIRQEIRAANHTTLVGAVGFITEAHSARDIVQGAEEEARATEAILSGSKPQADAVLMARQFLREPEWVLMAAKKLDVKVSLPWQFTRGLL